MISDPCGRHRWATVGRRRSLRRLVFNDFLENGAAYVRGLRVEGVVFVGHGDFPGFFRGGILSPLTGAGQVAMLIIVHVGESLERRPLAFRRSWRQWSVEVQTVVILKLMPNHRGSGLNALRS